MAPACASDLSIGSTARSVAMGGAGLALADNPSTTVVLNPAAPAASGARTRFMFPGLEFHSSGASFGDLTDSLDKLGSGNDDDALSLLSDFASHDTRLTFGTVTGFTGPLGVTIGGEAQAAILPGAAAAEWAGASQSFDSVTGINLSSLSAQIQNPHFQNAITTGSTSEFSAYLSDLSQNFVRGDFAYGPAISLSRGFTTASGGQLWLGTNLQFLKSEARVWQVTATGNLTNTTPGSVTADMSFDAVKQTVNTNTSAKMDVGMIYRPKDSMLQYGAVIENLIEPSLDGFADAKNERSLSLGLAIIPVKNFVWAADLVNINGANGENAQLRMGGELKFGKYLSLRTGYSGSNWTYGIGIFGINLAWEGSSAQLLTNIIKF